MKHLDTGDFGVKWLTEGPVDETPLTTWYNLSCDSVTKLDSMSIEETLAIIIMISKVRAHATVSSAFITAANAKVEASIATKLYS
jgi:hypothetical protein